MTFDSILAVTLLALMLPLGIVFTRRSEARLTMALFQCLVAAGLAATLFGAVQAVLIPGLRDDQVASYRGTFTPDQYEGRHWLRATIFVAVFAAVAASTLRMLLVRRDARPVYFASVVALIVATEFLRPYVHPGAGEEWCELGLFLSVATAGFAYLSPVRRWYVRPVPA